MRLYKFRKMGEGEIVVDLNEIETVSTFDRDGQYITQLGMKSGTRWNLDRAHNLNDVVQIWRETTQPTNLER